MAVILGVVPLDAADEQPTLAHNTSADLVNAACTPILKALGANDVKAAARQYRARRTHIGYPLMYCVSADPVLARRLAWMFIAVGDDHKAGQLYESLGRIEKAAVLYARAGDHGRAAELQLSRGNKHRAAELYEQHGSFEMAGELYIKIRAYAQAAKCFERIDRRLDAGRAWARAKELEKALDWLQQVTSDDPDFPAATELAVEILTKLGHPDLAVERCNDAIALVGQTLGAVPLFYRLGRALEKMGDQAGAREAYRQVVARAFNYRDARERLSRSAPAAHG